MSTRVGMYLRISLDPTGEHLATDRQRSANLATVQNRLHTDDVHVVEYMDNSLSAFRTRPASSKYHDLIRDARAGLLDVVVVWDLDRLTRIPREIEDWIDLAEKGAVRLLTADGEIDAGTENGRMYLRVKAATSRHEIETKSRRQRAAHEQSRAAGLPPPGSRCFGYEDDGVTIRAAEQAAVISAVDTVLAGGSLRSVVRAWNQAGHTTGRGTAWQMHSVRRYLLNPRIAGIRAYKEGRGTSEQPWIIAGPGVWEGLVPEETWHALRDHLSDPKRRTNSDPRRKWLLTSLALCGICADEAEAAGKTPGFEHRVKSGGRNRRDKMSPDPLPMRPTYVCVSSNHLSRLQKPVDDWVQLVLLKWLSTPDVVERLARDLQPDLKPLQRELRTARTRLSQLGDLVADGDLTPEEVRAASRRLRARIAELDAQIAAAGEQSAVTRLLASGDIPGTWKDMDVDQRRTVISSLARIKIYSPGQGARRFRPETVVVEQAF